MFSRIATSMSRNSLSSPLLLMGFPCPGMMMVLSVVAARFVGCHDHPVDAVAPRGFRPTPFFAICLLSWNPNRKWVFEDRGKAPRRIGVLALKQRGIGAMTKLELLYVEKIKKFDEICALVARELGYGELSTMNGEGRNRVEDEAKQYVEQWEETVEMRTSPTIRPITPLRRLLSQYHDICERILDEHELEEGLWAYKQGSRRRRPPASI